MTLFVPFNLRESIYRGRMNFLFFLTVFQEYFAIILIQTFASRDITFFFWKNETKLRRDPFGCFSNEMLQKNTFYTEMLQWSVMVTCLYVILIDMIVNWEQNINPFSMFSNKYFPVIINLI